MGLTASLLLAVSLASASLEVKPPRSTCNKQTQGQYWPEQANSDRKLAGQLMRSGDLQMCMRGFFRYNWEPLTLNIHKPKAKR